jgi:hypothetical protein
MIPQFLSLNPIPQRGQSATKAPEEALSDFDVMMEELRETNALQDVAIADPASFAVAIPSIHSIEAAPSHDPGAGQFELVAVSAAVQEPIGLLALSAEMPSSQDFSELKEEPQALMPKVATEPDQVHAKAEASVTLGANPPAYPLPENGGLGAFAHLPTAALRVFGQAPQMAKFTQTDVAQPIPSDRPIESELVKPPSLPNLLQAEGPSHNTVRDLDWHIAPKDSKNPQDIKSPAPALLGTIAANAAPMPNQSAKVGEVVAMLETAEVLETTEGIRPPKLADLSVGRRFDGVEMPRNIGPVAMGNLTAAVPSSFQNNDAAILGSDLRPSTGPTNYPSMEREIKLHEGPPVSQDSGRGSKPNVIFSKDQVFEKKAEQQFILRAPDFLAQPQESALLGNFQAPEVLSLGTQPAIALETKASISQQPQLAPAIFKQLAPHSTLAKSGAVELLLAPAELGNVKFQIHQQADSVRVVLSAERPETLDLFRRNSEQLLQEFKQAGFSGASLSFGQWDQQGKPTHTATPTPAFFDEDFVAVVQPIPPPLVKTSALPSGRGLDLRL